MGKQWKQWQTLFWGAPVSLLIVTVAMKLKDAYSLEEKLWPTRWRIKKQRHYFVKKVCLLKAVFPVVMYGCESWTIKEAEHQRIDAFELWCWRRLLRIPWTARRSNSPSKRKSVLNIHWKDWCWSWNSNTLAAWWEELTHLKRLWCWEWLKAGGGGDDRGWDGWMASLTQWTWVWVNSGRWWWTGRPGVQQCMESQWVGPDWATELNWTEQKTDM